MRGRLLKRLPGWLGAAAEAVPILPKPAGRTLNVWKRLYKQCTISWLSLQAEYFR
jgi:hypothetical protein